MSTGSMRLIGFTELLLIVILGVILIKVLRGQSGLAARPRAGGAGFCTRCGQPLTPGGSFCAFCGSHQA